jgi:hypothetical protein
MRHDVSQNEITIAVAVYRDYIPAGLQIANLSDRNKTVIQSLECLNKLQMANLIL